MPLKVAHPPGGELFVIIAVSPFQATSKEALSSWETELTSQTHSSLVWVTTRLTLYGAWLVREIDE